MQNRTELSVNETSPKSFSVIIKVCVVIPFFCVFLYFITVMLQIFASHRQFLDTSRYIIFIFPVIEFSIGKHTLTVDVFSTNILCKPAVINSSPIQGLYRFVVNVLFFAVVSVIILFTYVRIMMETRKMRQDRASVNKAMHTVLLHGFQLLLCLLAFTQPIAETLIGLHTNWLAEDVAFFNYFCFILIPRFLSPLIYGFRDQSLKRHIENRFLCWSKRDKPFFK
ncbi:PREDICTED: uncharacterized protein LOC106927689 [Poecilia mexicana]|uniref:uncharacterized protein LOC106927689 n=1 Tax=Poecilia mexicana TaxID=48701 RepID=UPI00072DD701|nr:PREDICTED: uncharacterized protein LOC106927689 [Poecilia mexicana]